MNQDNETEFARRAAALLRDSVDHLDGATRSKLAQARSKALAQRNVRSRWLDVRYLAPAGAMAAGLLVSVIFITRQNALHAVNDSTEGTLYDLELLADSDGYELTQETDLEFIEWAAAVGEEKAGT